MGILTSPRSTYAGIAARPRIAGALALVLLLTIVPTMIFLSTEVGQDALFDQQIRSMESFGVQIPEQAYAQMEARLQYAPYFTGISQLVVVPVMMAITAGLIIAIFNAGLGGNATFKQVFAVVAHSSLVPSLHPLLSMPLNYVRGSMTSATSLGVFTPFLDEASFPARLLGVLDLFYIWWFINLAIGVGVLYKKRTAPIAWGFLAVYLVIALAIAGVMRAFSGA